MDKNESLPVDFEAALAQFDGERDFMFEMFKDYKASLPQRMEEIHAAFHNSDTKKLLLCAHNLKGVSLSFCAKPVVDLSKQLEETIKRGDMYEISALIAELDMEVRRLEDYLANHLPQ